MKTLLAIAITIAASLGLVNNVYAASPLKGGSCFTRSTIPDAYGVTYSCDYLGQVKNIKEIYDKGFRVINSVVISTSEGKGYFIIIEERK
jgi:hypothetical protein